MRKEQTATVPLPAAIKAPPPASPPAFMLPPQRQPIATPGEEETTEVKPWRQFWNALAKADDEKKIEMVREKLREVPSSELTGGVAFDLIDSLSTSLQRTGRWAEVEDDLNQLRKLHPDAYEEDRMCFEYWRTENAILSGADPTPDFLRLCEGANKVIDSFFQVLEMMRYHGHHEALLEGLPTALHVVENDENIMKSASIKILEFWVDQVLHEHLKRDSELRSDDAELNKALSRIPLIDKEAVNRTLEIRQLARGQTWTHASFDDGEQASRALAMLLWSFGALLDREAKWPAARQDQARVAVFKMLREMAQRDAEESQARSQKQTQKTRGQKTKATAHPRTRSLLIPDVKKLESHLAQCLKPIFGAPYQGEVLLQALPWWLAFLVEKGLEDKANAQQIWQSVREKFASSILKIVTKPGRDRVLAQHLRETFDREELPVVAKQD